MIVWVGELWYGYLDKKNQSNTEVMAKNEYKIH
jgi:hypothetical protein